ncbi:MAG: APC family permease [Propionibacteriaceae bacterium]|nr:APC family permease [Propionibacteriaceae bacterium]
MEFLRALKRVLLGRKLASAQLSGTLLPKRIALPVFASDALSSVAYAPDEILITLSLAGMAAFTLSWPIAIAVGAVMLVVVLSYRQTVHAYPSGGGDYEVASTNLGKNAGLTVASALLVDYVLTVAVSISSGVQNAAAMIPALHGYERWVALGIILLLMLVNLRGIRDSGGIFAIPTYCFMFAVLAMAGWGFLRIFGFGEHLQAPTANLEVVGDSAYTSLTGVALVILLARAFSSGCAALTGVEAISNGVPSFREPKSKNAATTLALLGGIAVTMLLSIVTLANLTGLKLVDTTGGSHFTLNGQPVTENVTTAMGQLASTIFDGFPFGFYFTITATTIILFLAANTAFNGFPVLGSILSRDSYLPRSLHVRGDRLAFSNGIIMLALAAGGLVVLFDANVTALIQLYVVGVFVSFTVSQTGMLRHWAKLLKTETEPRERLKMRRSQLINTVGLICTGAVLVVVLVSKFTHGAYLAVGAMILVFIAMKAIHGHYMKVYQQIAVTPKDAHLLPSRVRAVVIVIMVNKPTIRAVNYALATHADMVEAVTAAADPDDTDAVLAAWEAENMTIPLKVLASPYREVVTPLFNYVKSIRSSNPRDVVAVYVPEYVVAHWWEQPLHNETGLILKARLNMLAGVIVTSVPYLLPSASRMVRDPLMLPESKDEQA